MKRSWILAVAVSMAFVACQKKEEVPEETTPAVETTPAPAPAAPAAPMDTGMAHDTTGAMTTPATTTSGS
ncbi:MAG TPA: hypothetical protein VFQ38_24450 [Longimicrobiales bacterium]|nr:hypothetical protein [Longimicrobiales bacterium]